MIPRTNRRRGRLIPIFALLLVTSGFFVACKGRPARKKLPDFAATGQSFEGTSTTVDRKIEQIPGFPPFYATDTTVRIGGRPTDLLAIALPDPGYDSLAMHLVTAYVSLASSLLDQLRARGEKGVLIDCRTGANQNGLCVQHENYRIDILTDGKASLSLPVVFSWNGESAARAASFIRELQTLPGFQCTLIDGSPGHPLRQSDCFSADSPVNFDQQ